MTGVAVVISKSHSRQMNPNTTARHRLASLNQSFASKSLIVPTDCTLRCNKPPAEAVVVDSCTYCKPWCSHRLKNDSRYNSHLPLLRLLPRTTQPRLRCIVHTKVARENRSFGKELIGVEYIRRENRHQQSGVPVVYSWLLPSICYTYPRKDQVQLDLLQRETYMMHTLTTHRHTAEDHGSETGSCGLRACHRVTSSPRL